MDEDICDSAAHRALTGFYVAGSGPLAAIGGLQVGSAPGPVSGAWNQRLTYTGFPRQAG